MTNVTCLTLIEECLPDLRQSDPEFRTGGPSLSSGYTYDGTIIRWDDFEQEVERFIYGEGQTHRIPNNHMTLFQRPPGPARARFETEAYLCGEEKGVEGRFNHQVMHTLQHAAQLGGLSVRLGDFRATQQGQGNASRVPDMACMTIGPAPKQYVRVLGECKADWIGQMLGDYDMGDERIWISTCF